MDALLGTYNIYLGPPAEAEVITCATYNTSKYRFLQRSNLPKQKINILALIYVSFLF